MAENKKVKIIFTPGSKTLNEIIRQILLMKLK